MTEADFQTLLASVRAGDELAATRLVQYFEPILRRQVRLYLTDPRLREVLDSLDLCQSILGHFFVRTAAGQFDIEHPGQLVQLLATMARNKVINLTRCGWRKAKDATIPIAHELLDHVPYSNADPAVVVERKELLSTIREAVPVAMRNILDKRLAGFSWQEIAESLGEPADTIRKRYARMLDPIVARLEQSFLS